MQRKGCSRMLLSELSCLSLMLSSFLSSYFLSALFAGVEELGGCSAAHHSSCSSIGNTSNSRLIIRSNSSRVIPADLAMRNKLFISVLMCCLIANSA